MNTWGFQDHEECPICQQQETAEHVMKCPNGKVTSNWNNAIDKLDNWLTANSTHPNIQQSIIMSKPSPQTINPADVTVTADLGSCFATGVALGTPIVTDNCPGESYSNDAPSSFPVGTTTVTWTATDAAGNTASCTQTVTVTDDELPVITCGIGVTVSITLGVCGTES